MMHHGNAGKNNLPISTSTFYTNLQKFKPTIPLQLKISPKPPRYQTSVYSLA